MISRLWLALTNDSWKVSTEKFQQIQAAIFDHRYAKNQDSKNRLTGFDDRFLELRAASASIPSATIVGVEYF
jgi:hypothetical protein